MNKAVLALFLLLSATCTLANVWGYGGYGGYGNYGGYGGYNSGYGGYGGYSGGSSAGNKEDFSQKACSYAVANANGAFEQVIIDAKKQANDWILYADLDAVDEIGYYLANTCNTKNFAIVSKGKNDQACNSLGKLLQSILDQEEVQAFRGGYQKALQLGEKALKLGKSLGKGCEIKLAQKDLQASKEKSQQKQEEKADGGQDDNQDQIDKWTKIGQEHADLAKSLNRKYENEYKNQQNKKNVASQEEEDLSSDEESANEGEYNWSEEEYSSGEENELNEESNWESEENNLNEEEYQVGEAEESNEESNWYPGDFGHGWNGWGEKFGSEEETQLASEEETSSLNEEENSNWNEEEHQIGEAGESNEEESNWFPGDFGHGWNGWGEKFGSEEETQLASEEETSGLNEEEYTWSEEEYSFGEENELNEESNWNSEEEGNFNEEEYQVGESGESNEEAVNEEAIEELSLEEGKSEEGSVDEVDILVFIQEGEKENKHKLSNNSEESDISDVNVDDLVNFISNPVSELKDPTKASWTFYDQINQVNDYLDLMWE